MNSTDPALQARLKRETEFHDIKYLGATTPRHYRVCPTECVYAHMLKAMGDLHGKQVVEYGCGNGWLTRDLAALGGSVSAFDISPQAVRTTVNTLADAKLLDRCAVGVMPAEALTYPSGTFDVAVGFAIIHHLDIVRAFAELHRVLKPGGVAYFAEPLATNPLIQAYRRLTPQFRTADEQPLLLSNLPGLMSSFRSLEHREFYLTALAAVGLTYVPGGARVFPRLSAALHRVDRRLLRMLPALGNWAWYTLIRITK